MASAGAAPPVDYGRGYCAFVRVEQPDVAADVVHFVFEETVPGSCTPAFLRAVHGQVGAGAAAWSSGDLGDVTPEIAERCGFQAEWCRALAQPVVGGTSDDAVLRVTLCRGARHRILEGDVMGERRELIGPDHEHQE